MGDNVRTLSDLPNSRSNAYQIFSQQPGLIEDRSSLKFIDLFFPGFTWKSCVVVLSIIEFIIFIISLFFGSSNLTPSGLTLLKLGASYGPFIQKGQVFRFITPIFLHASIWHVLGNTFFQTRIGLQIEKKYGLSRTAAIYFVSGVAGIIFSLALAPCVTAVGASTCGFGLIGVQLTEVIIFWNVIENKEQTIISLALFIAFTMIFFLSSNSTIDWRGHFGGMLAGAAMTLYYNKYMDYQQDWIKKYGQMVAITILGCMYIGGLLVVFLIPMEGPHGRCQA